MTKPDFIPSADWSIILVVCGQYGVDPLFIAAIGWHETHWGRLGAGKIGFILGYGYWPGSTVKDKYKGLRAQLKGACGMIKSHLNLPITLISVTDFAVNHWKSSAPRGWAKSVYSIYHNLTGGITPPRTDTEVVDQSDKIIFTQAEVIFFKSIYEFLERIFGNEQ